MGTTRCDIIRDMAEAFDCGLCTGGGAGNCQNIPASVCSIPSAANSRMALFADKYNPLNMFGNSATKASVKQAEADYVTGIQATEAQLAQDYPYASKSAVSISWPDIEYCLWRTDGERSGPFNNKYFERDDALAFGMQPVYPIGGGFAANAVWPQGTSSSVPLAFDYLMNPSLLAIAVLVLLLLVLVGLLLAAARDKKRAPYLRDLNKQKRLAALEQDDPYKGTAFPSYISADAKCRTYVEAMEMKGYDMTEWRKKCGLPVRP